MTRVRRNRGAKSCVFANVRSFKIFRFRHRLLVNVIRRFFARIYTKQTLQNRPVDFSSPCVACWVSSPRWTFPAAGGLKTARLSTTSNNASKRHDGPPPRIMPQKGKIVHHLEQYAMCMHLSSHAVAFSLERILGELFHGPSARCHSTRRDTLSNLRLCR